MENARLGFYSEQGAGEWEDKSVPEAAGLLPDRVEVGKVGGRVH